MGKQVFVVMFLYSFCIVVLSLLLPVEVFLFILIVITIMSVKSGNEATQYPNNNSDSTK